MENVESTTQVSKRRRLIAVGIPVVMGWIFAFLATNVLGAYTTGLFIWLPFVMGATSTILCGYKNPVKKGRLLEISGLTLVLFCLGLLVFAWEGVICLMMAFPIGALFTWLGHLAGYAFLKTKLGNTYLPVILLFISVPAVMGFDDINAGEDQLRSVTTSIIINATPEKVWRNVIAFPQLKDPDEFIFKTGIAYPINATIDGNGVGAIRHCNFSTGSFTEPITVWDEPYVLRFSVSEQPETMKEFSFYNIHPNHLHGYWVSKQGQFTLTPLADGRTQLVGTTWYVNKIKPGFYWNLWSDYIVHKIHERVLEHIKVEAEKR